MTGAALTGDTPAGAGGTAGGKPGIADPYGVTAGGAPKKGCGGAAGSGAVPGGVGCAAIGGTPGAGFTICEG